MEIDAYDAMHNVSVFFLFDKPPLITVWRDTVKCFAATLNMTHANLIEAIDDFLITFHVFNHLKE